MVAVLYDVEQVPCDLIIVSIKSVRRYQLGNGGLRSYISYAQGIMQTSV